MGSLREIDVGSSSNKLSSSECLEFSSESSDDDEKSSLEDESEDCSSSFSSFSLSFKF